MTGICNTDSCEVEGKEVVVVKGIGVYNFYEQEHENKCPMCKKYVHCSNIVFSRCKYSYKGVAKELGEAPRKLKTEAPVIVREDWLEFRTDKCGKLNWIRLIITTEPLDDVK